MIKKRDLVTSIILSIVTCGIYGIIWFVEITDDAKVASNDQTLPSGGTAFLLSFITCGIYSIFWASKIGKAINKDVNAEGKENVTVGRVLKVFGKRDKAYIQTDIVPYLRGIGFSNI